MNTALLDLEAGAEPIIPPDSCLVIDGYLVLASGTMLDCSSGLLGEREEAAPSAPAKAPPSTPTEAGHSPSTEAAPSLSDTVTEAEGGSNLAYCDPAGLHIGDGIHLSNDERALALCLALDQARVEARRTLGYDTFVALDEARRDTWVELCYWAPCAQFTRAIEAMRRGDYVAAGQEVFNSRLPSIDFERAERISRWLSTGDRS